MSAPYSGVELRDLCAQIRREFPSQDDCLHSWHGPSGVVEISLARLEATANAILGVTADIDTGAEVPA
jgi:hypothetical protein